MTILYRCKDGVTDYGFSIARIPDGRHLAYITQQPQYGELDSGFEATHRSQDVHGIYVEGGPAWTPEAARENAALWAEANQRYLISGRWEWDVTVSPRHLGVICRVFPNYSFAHDDALHRDVLLLAKFAPPGFVFEHGNRISYAIVVDDRGRGLQAREIRNAISVAANSSS